MPYKYSRFTDRNLDPLYRRKVDRLFESLFPDRDERGKAKKTIREMVESPVVLPVAHYRTQDSIILDQVRIQLRSEEYNYPEAIKAEMSNPASTYNTNATRKAQIDAEIADPNSRYNKCQAYRDNLNQTLTQIWEENPRTDIGMWVQRSSAGKSIIEQTRLSGILDLSGLDQNDIEQLKKVYGKRTLEHLTFEELREFAGGSKQRRDDYARLISGGTVDPATGKITGGKTYEEELRRIQQENKAYKKALSQYKKDKALYEQGLLAIEPTPPTAYIPKRLFNIGPLSSKVIAVLDRFERRRGLAKEGRTAWAETMKDMGNPRNRVRGRDSALNFTEYTYETIDLKTGKNVTITAKANELLDPNGQMRSNELFPEENNAYAYKKAEQARRALADNQRRSRAIGDSLGALMDTANEIGYSSADMLDQERRISHAKTLHKWIAINGMGAITIKRDSGKIQIGNGFTKELDLALRNGAVLNQETIFGLMGASEENKRFCIQAPKRKGDRQTIEGFKTLLTLHLAAIARTAQRDGRSPDVFKKLNEVNVERLLSTTNPAGLSADSPELYAYTAMIGMLKDALVSYIQNEYGELKDPLQDALTGDNKSLMWNGPIAARAKPTTPQELIDLKNDLENWNPNIPLSVNLNSPLIQKIVRHLDVAGRKVFSNETKFQALLDDVVFMPGGHAGYRMKVISKDGEVYFYNPNKDLDLELKTANVIAAETLNYQLKSFAKDPILFPVTTWYNFVGNQFLDRTKINGLYKWGKDQYYNLTDWGQKDIKTPKMGDLQFSNLFKNAFLKLGDGTAWKLDPESGKATPNYLYIMTSTYNSFLDWFAGIDDNSSGWFENTIKNFAVARNWKTWKLNDKGEMIKDFWEPSFFKSSRRKKRLKDNKSILDVLLDIAISLTGNLVYLGLQRIPFVGKAVTYLVTNIQRGVDTIKLLPETIFKKLVPLETPGVGLSKIWNQSTLTKIWSWARAGWGLPKHLIKAVVKSAAPFVMAGLIFNNPFMAFTAGGMALVPNLLKELAIWSSRFPNVGGKWESFKTLETLFGKGFDHIKAAKLFTGLVPSMPHLFGLEKVLFAGSEATGYRLKSNLVAKLLGNHATIRGLINGLGTASYGISIGYLLTGNYAVAALFGVGAVVGNIAYEHIASFVAHKLSKYVAFTSATTEFLGNTIIGSVQYAAGISFIRNMIGAAYKTYIQGDPEAWNDWKQQYATGFFPTLGSISTVVLGVQGLFSITGSVVKFSNALFHIFVKSNIATSFQKLVGSTLIGRVALVGALIGSIIGMVIGGWLGASTGGLIGGAILGSLGAVLGGTGLLATILTGAVVIVFSLPGVIIGAIVGGIIGSLIGVGIEKLISPLTQNISSFFQSAYQGITTLVSLLGALKLLMSRNAADVASAALTLALSGILTITAIGNTSLASSSYVVSSGSGGDAELGGVVEPLPSQIKNLKKEFVAFENDGKDIRYKIYVENTDPDGKPISVKVTDNFKVDNTSNINSTPASSPGTDGLTANVAEETIAPGEEKIYEIVFSHDTEKFQGIGGVIEGNKNEMICNKAIVTGTVEGVSGSDFDGRSTICIDKEGKKVYAGEGVAEAAYNIVNGLQPAWWSYYNLHPSYPQHFDASGYQTAPTGNGSSMNPSDWDSTCFTIQGVRTCSCSAGFNKCPDGYKTSRTNNSMFWCNLLPYYSYKDAGITFSSDGVTGQRKYVRNNGEYNGVYLDVDKGSNNCLTQSDLNTLKGSELKVNDIQVGDVAFFAKDFSGGCYDLDAHVAIVAEVTSSYVKTYDSNNYAKEIKYTVLPDGSIDKNGSLIFNGVGRMQ